MPPGMEAVFDYTIFYSLLQEEKRIRHMKKDAPQTWDASLIGLNYSSTGAASSAALASSRSARMDRLTFWFSLSMSMILASTT